MCVTDRDEDALPHICSTCTLFLSGLPSIGNKVRAVRAVRARAVSKGSWFDALGRLPMSS